MSIKRCLSYVHGTLLAVWIIYSIQRLGAWCFDEIFEKTWECTTANVDRKMDAWTGAPNVNSSFDQLLHTQRSYKLLHTQRSLNAFRCWCTPSQIFSASSSPYYHTLNHNKRQFTISPSATLRIAFWFPNFSEAITFIFGRYSDFWLSNSVPCRFWFDISTFPFIKNVQKLEAPSKVSHIQSDVRSRQGAVSNWGPTSICRTLSLHF